MKNQNVDLTWFGHSAFLIQSLSGKRILIDPWLDNPLAPPDSIDIDNIDFILITHGHSDHIGNSVDIAQRTGAKVISIFEIYLHLKNHGVNNGQGMNKGGALILDNLKFTMVDAKHSSGIDFESSVIAGGEAAGYIIELENGFKIYHAGDTSLFGDMEIIGDYYKPDIALLPIGGLYTMGPEEAAYACKLLKPKYIIGMHYGTFPVLTGSPESLRKLLKPELKNKVVELQPGKKVSF
ncbi:MAG: metal-dependent hydrolase [Ignavibacteriales bacterium]|nr:metal-dependent hydrolase [Ignavibacteriales bacterium]